MTFAHNAPYKHECQNFARTSVDMKQQAGLPKELKIMLFRKMPKSTTQHCENASR